MASSLPTLLNFIHKTSILKPPDKPLTHIISTRRFTLLLIPLIPQSFLLTKPAKAIDFSLTVPDQTVEEAERNIQLHAANLLKVKDLLESDSLKVAQKALRKSSALLKQDIYTILQGKPPGERPRLRKMYSDLFNEVLRLDYAARDEDRIRIWECYRNIVLYLDDILSRL